MNNDKYLQAFDEKFGTDGPDCNCDSIGRRAGCDDCPVNIETRQEHRQFLTQALLAKEEEVVKAERERLVEKVGFLRQWLNEDRITDPNKMVTNEELLEWLRDK